MNEETDSVITETIYETIIEEYEYVFQTEYLIDYSKQKFANRQFLDKSHTIILSFIKLEHRRHFKHEDIYKEHKINVTGSKTINKHK